VREADQRPPVGAHQRAQHAVQHAHRQLHGLADRRWPSDLDLRSWCRRAPLP
jgi:hypothetical protein